MTAPAGFPLRLLRSALPDGRQHADERFQPVAHAYVLVDLSNTARNTEEDFVHTAHSIRATVSGDVTWRLALVTNARGELVDYSLGNDPLSDPAVARTVDALPPLAVPLGLEMNLWWCLDHETYTAAMRQGGPVRHEYQLGKVCTYLPREDREQCRYAVEIARLLWPQEDAVGAAEARLLRTRSDRRGRSPVYLDLAAGAFCLHWKDEVLDAAMSLAERVIEAFGLPHAHDLGEHAAMLARLEGILHRRMDVPNPPHLANDVIPYAQRRRGEYQITAGNLQDCMRSAASAVNQVGAVLGRSIRQAIDECRWHYPADQGQRAAASLLNARGLTLIPALRDALDAEEVPPNLRTAIERGAAGGAQAGEHRNVPLQEMFEDLHQFSEWCHRSAELFIKASEFLEGAMQETVHAREVTQIRVVANVRAVMFAFYQRGRFIPASPGPTRVPMSIALPLDNTTHVRIIAHHLHTAGEALERFDRALKVLNALFTVYELYQHPDFRHYLETANSMGEVATMSERVCESVARFLQIEVPALQGAVTGLGCVVSVLQASEAAIAGNNTAFLGCTIQACGTLIGLSAIPGAGLLAAAVVIAGAALVAFSLDEDERWIFQVFNAAEGEHPSSWTRGDAARQAVDRFDADLHSRENIRWQRQALDAWGLPA